MIKMGTSDMMVAAIPVSVYFTASRENDTPRKGPKKDPVIMPVIPFLLLRASRTLAHFPISVTITINPTIPEMIRICVDAKGSYVFIPSLLNTSPVACPKAPAKAKRIPLGESFNDNLSFFPLLKIAIAIPENVSIIPK